MGKILKGMALALGSVFIIGLAIRGADKVVFDHMWAAVSGVTFGKLAEIAPHFKPRPTPALQRMVEASAMIFVRSRSIFGGLNGGSAVAVASSGPYTFYLTNKHVADGIPFRNEFEADADKPVTEADLESGRVAGAFLVRLDGSATPVDVVLISKKFDLAIVRAKVKSTLAVIAPSMPEFLETVTVVGAPFLMYPTVTEGYITGTKKNILGEKNPLFISAGTAPGNSGSAVFNSRGEIVGLIYAGSRGFHGAGLAINYTSVKEFMADVAFAMSNPAIMKKLELPDLEVMPGGL